MEKGVTNGKPIIGYTNKPKRLWQQQAGNTRLAAAIDEISSGRETDPCQPSALCPRCADVAKESRHRTMCRTLMKAPSIVFTSGQKQAVPSFSQNRRAASVCPGLN
jgi:hypothetical protein